MAMAVNAKDSVTGEKLAALRGEMARFELDAYLVPSVDEHINEYLPENKARRAWVSGFTGSAGDFLLTKDEAWLFADSRYHEQADYEVSLAHIRVSKLGLDGQPALGEKIKELAGRAKRFRLGFDPFTLTVQQAQAFQKAFDGTAIELVPVHGNLVDPLWRDAPAPKHSRVFALPQAVTGKTWRDKLAAVQDKLKTGGIDVLPVTKLDQIAWLFNLRGQDIPYNPLFMAYAIISPDQALLFMDASRLDPAALDDLRQGVDIRPYEDYGQALQTLSAERTVLIDPKHTTQGTWLLVTDHGRKPKEADHPVELMKAVKDETELRGMKTANLKASRGKIRAWYWLERQLKAGVTVTEADFRDAIERFYAEEEGFFGLSFNTISGAGANTSIVHYGTPSAEKTLEPGELFLIDSGCQFLGADFAGTTDDTRTVLVGDTPTELQVKRYTEVLKAHINCAMQQFPRGTEGARLDGITRSTLWRHSLDYGHGTGHGVGAFLNVHEGPNGIHRLAHKALEPGMINSIEPGYYEPGWGGIRLENLYAVVEFPPEAGEASRWLTFESLTYVPFDKKLIDFGALNADQLTWLYEYNKMILAHFRENLPPEESEWLKEICEIQL